MICLAGVVSDFLASKFNFFAEVNERYWDKIAETKFGPRAFSNQDVYEPRFDRKRLNWAAYSGEVTRRIFGAAKLGACFGAFIGFSAAGPIGVVQGAFWGAATAGGLRLVPNMLNRFCTYGGEVVALGIEVGIDTARDAFDNYIRIAQAQQCNAPEEQSVIVGMTSAELRQQEEDTWDREHEINASQGDCLEIKFNSGAMPAGYREKAIEGRISLAKERLARQIHTRRTPGYSLLGHA